MKPAGFAPRLLRLALLGFLLFGSSGCGYLFTHAPPPDHRELEDFSCTESNGGPIIDLIWAGLNLIAVLGAIASPDAENRDAVFAGGLFWVALTGPAAGVGFNKTKKCRAAKRELARRQRQERVGPEPVPAGLVVRAVRISPVSATLTVGDRLQLLATAYDSSGAAIPNTAFAWSSSNDAIASVSPAGLVTAHAAGQVVIAANTNNFVGTANIVVRSQGAEVTPEPPDADKQSNAARLRGDYRRRLVQPGQ